MHINYWQGIKSNSIGKLGLILLVIVIAMAFLSPVFTSFNPADQTSNSFESPSARHFLGTNDVGQDIFIQLLHGARSSLLTAVTVALFSTVISVLVGASAGLIEGVYDKIIMRFVDALLVIPPMVLVVIFAAYIQPDTWHLIIMLSILIWPGGARIVRAQTLALKKKVHISAARTFGAGTLYILVRHIIPDLGPIIAATMIQGARRAVFMEAGLSFLGVTDPMSISWGKMLYQSLKYVYLDVWQWWLIPVGFALSITVMAFTFIGYALEETMDPRLRRGKHAAH